MTDDGQQATPHPKDGWSPTVTLGPLADSLPADAGRPERVAPTIQPLQPMPCYDCGDGDSFAWLCRCCRRCVCVACWLARHTNDRRLGCALPEA